MDFRGFSLYYLFLALSCELWILGSESLTCNPNDLRALHGFSSCLETEVAGWNSTIAPDCCSWTGVICDSSSVSSRRVIGLELGHQRLKGNISASLADLNQLRVLNLSYNYLRGALPAELFKLQNIEVIDVSQNDLTGSINRGICSASVGIRELNFSDNCFSGEVPKDLANCTSLRLLSFNGNYLSGSLPENIFQVRNLGQVYLQDNMISGPLNHGFGNLLNLVKLDISSNFFSGVLPDVFLSLTRLEHFSANSNLFTGRLPASLVSSPSLQMLSLNNNSLSGPINFNCSAMKNLVFMDLGSNLFQGPIDSLSSCKTLKELNLARNNLDGELPNGFKNLQALTHLSLSNTSLRNISSALETLQYCRNLMVLILTMDFQEEEMPHNLNLHFKNLQGLALANSKLRGSIPKWLSSCRKLRLLDLSFNHLDGSIPSWIGGFESLFYLDLSNNFFNGEITKSLTELRSLISGNFSFEERFSSFPLYYRGRRARTQMYKQMSRLPPTIDLSHNMLEGPIWPDFGRLKKLHVLNLSKNNLTGTIPYNLSAMTSLEILDLSKNKLSGEIPYSLVDLTFLSAFNVASNQLSGEIPRGNQFLTFPDSSFAGNICLCLAGCPCESAQTPTDLAREKTTNFIGLPLGIGAATGFVLSVTYCFMSGWVFSKSKRQERSNRNVN